MAKPIAWGCAILLAALVLTQIAAGATGLASGEYEFEGWRMYLTGGLMILYDLAVIFLGITCIRFISRLHTGLSQGNGSAS
jgi:hypothetical protein